MLFRSQALVLLRSARKLAGKSYLHNCVDSVADCLKISTLIDLKLTPANEAMSKTFIDSNVVLYLFSSDKVKANRAESMLRSGGLISVQVLNEVASVCLRKLKMSWADIDLVLQALKNNCEVLPLSLASHEKAVDLAKRFQISFYEIGRAHV